MSTERKRPKLNWKPATPVARRLEHVRHLHGVPTLRAFFDRLVEPRSPTDTYQLSYAAVRNYHFDREPPASYLARVAQVFGIKLEWLITGEGEPTAEREAAANLASTAARSLLENREVRREITEAFPAFALIPPFFQDAALQAWSAHVLRGSKDSRFGPTSPTETAVQHEFATRIGRALMAPFECLGIPTDDVNDHQLLLYVLAISHALLAISESKSVTERERGLRMAETFNRKLAPASDPDPDNELDVTDVDALAAELDRQIAKADADWPARGEE